MEIIYENENFKLEGPIQIGFDTVYQIVDKNKREQPELYYELNPAKLDFERYYS